jgi:Txe/YoeB family toxin of Txe-Axe toxin-antitoxin module
MGFYFLYSNRAFNKNNRLSFLKLSRYLQGICRTLIITPVWCNIKWPGCASRNRAICYQRIERVEEFGIDEVRKIKGFHDEPLKGDRIGQRSIRLNRSYRAIYKESPGKVEIIIILEVHNHDY